MNILAIDTTTKIASVAIYNGKNITEEKISNEITHSEKLLPLIDETLNKCKLTLKDINMYACINGPGSFTGIRIGLSTLKAFSMIDNNKTFSIESTKLIAYKALIESKKSSATIASLIDARNDRVYYAVYKLSLNNDKINIQTLLDISNDTIDVALKNISTINDITIIAGDCIYKFSDILSNLFKSTYNFYPSTTDLIEAYFKIDNVDNYMYDTYTLDAIYARPSQAERIKNGSK